MPTLGRAIAWPEENEKSKGIDKNDKPAEIEGEGDADAKIENKPPDKVNSSSLSFKEFIKDSTFHGVKYIVEEAHATRR